MGCSSNLESLDRAPVALLGKSGCWLLLYIWCVFIVPEKINHVSLGYLNAPLGKGCFFRPSVGLLCVFLVGLLCCGVVASSCTLWLSCARVLLVVCCGMLWYAVVCCGLLWYCMVVSCCLLCVCMLLVVCWRLLWYAVVNCGIAWRLLAAL